MKGVNNLVCLISFIHQIICNEPNFKIMSEFTAIYSSLLRKIISAKKDM